MNATAQAKNSAKDVEKNASSILNSVTDFAELAQDKVTDVAEMAGDYGQDLVKNTRKLVKRYPAEAIGIGLAVGFGIGFLLFRSR